MKKYVLIVLVNLMLFNFCKGQNATNLDFFEIGIRSGKFIESQYLENSSYQDQLSDPKVEVQGFIASATGRNYAAKIRYGKSILNNAHLIGELSFTTRDEQVICFCHICDKASRPSTLVNVNSLDLGTGFRYQIVEHKKIKLLVEGIGHLSIRSNESDAGYFGYSIHPIIQYELDERLNINLRYGFEQSFGEYKRKERYFELAFNYQIKK